MTNLKSGSGPTREPAQGPQICLILGDLCWSSNRRSVDPEPSLKGLRSAERGIFFFIWGPELTLYEGSDVVPHSAVQHICIVSISTDSMPHSTQSRRTAKTLSENLTWIVIKSLLTLHDKLWLFIIFVMGRKPRTVTNGSIRGVEGPVRGTNGPFNCGKCF